MKKTIIDVIFGKTCKSIHTLQMASQEPAFHAVPPPSRKIVVSFTVLYVRLTFPFQERKVFKIPYDFYFLRTTFILLQEIYRSVNYKTCFIKIPYSFKEIQIRLIQNKNMRHLPKGGS